MLAAFESILPVFLLIVAGGFLRRSPLIDQGAWRGLEQLGYWFLYPILLFVTIYNADFAGLQVDAMMVSLLLSVAAMCLLTYALWTAFQRLGMARRSEFSSVFQTTVRWNGFMALAIAQKMFPPAGMAVVALAMAVIIMPINVASVFVVTHFADRRTDWRKMALSMATNPLILPCIAAILLRQLPFHLYGPLNETLKLIASAALGMGLLAVGAGLRPEDFQPRLTLLIPVVLKLLLFPVVLIGIAVALGVRGENLAYLALCSAVPTATNGYLLARQLGGDAELYAAVTMLQTAVSFFTIPAMIALARQFAG